MTSLRVRYDTFRESQLTKLNEKELRHAKLLPTWRTKRRRRSLALVMLTGSLVMITGAAIVDDDTIWVFVGLWFGGFVIGAVPWALLRVLTGPMGSGFSTLLDEREQAWRHRVNHIGFNVLIGLMLLSMFYGMVISGQPGAGMRGATMTGALVVLGACVPSTVLGWTLPDDDPEDFAGGGPEDD
jgi:hypothetical protein